jgi:aminopeptidase N
MHPRLKRWEMTRSKDPAQAGEEAKRVMPHRLDLGFAPSEAHLELFEKWLAKIEPDIKFPAVIHGTAGSGKSSLAAKLFYERFLAECQARLTNEPPSRVFSQIRPALPTAERVGEEALRARVSELEQKLAEAEHINRVQRSRLSEERRAAATANRINDQLQQRLDVLQKRLDRQFDLINERARANDVALAALASKSQGRLLTYETLQGEVIEVSEAEVVVRFDTGDDLVEQTYDLRQFTLGKTPAEGDQLAVYVHVALVAPPSLAAGTESKADLHDSPRPRRNVITGDHRF